MRIGGKSHGGSGVGHAPDLKKDRDSASGQRMVDLGGYKNLANSASSCIAEAQEMSLYL
jgi:hypothetical protein